MVEHDNEVAFVAIAATPATTNDIASVPMRALIRNRVTMMPLERPDREPDAEGGQGPPGDYENVTRCPRSRRQPVDRADRQVDAAGNEDQRAGTGHDDDPSLLVEDVGQVLGPQERRADQAQDHEQDHERDRDPEPADQPARAR